MTQPYDDDPFAQTERHPSISWKDKPIGTRLICKIVDAPQLVQSRDFDTGELAFWDDAKQQPKMSVVTTIETGAGDVMSLWAQKPSALFAAIAEAQQRAGARIAKGGTLTVEYVGDKANPDKPRLNPAKQFRATYAPPSAFDAPTTPPTRQRDEPMLDAEPPF